MGGGKIKNQLVKHIEKGYKVAAEKLAGKTIRDNLEQVASYGIEIVEEAVNKANENARLNGLNNCEFIAGDVFAKLDEFDKQGIEPDIIILDPPRAGVREKAITKILKYNVKNIVYVSCNPKSLVQDLRLLEINGYVAENSAPSE